MSKVNKEIWMDRGTRREKSQRAREKRKNVKKLKETLIEKLYRSLRYKIKKLIKTKSKNHDGR